jgi:tetratricopeptide (TPR) repeat protein
MIHHFRIFVLTLVATLTWAPFCPSQTRAKQPGLIRDTEEAEGKDDSQSKKPKEYDPIESEKNLKIGDYYLKQKNYRAAIQRYLEAIEYQPSRSEAYESLARAYERNEQHAKVAEVYREFLSKNPESPRASEFLKKIAKLEEK